LRYMLGFPGIELGIADGAWSIVIKTRCRHLKDRRCSLYGAPERPALCVAYDATTCTYREQFGTPRPTGFVRVRLEEFETLAQSFGFDEGGRIVEGMRADKLRRFIETRLSAPAVSVEKRQLAISLASAAGPDAFGDVATSLNEALQSL